MSPKAQAVADQKLAELEAHQRTSKIERAVAINVETGAVYYDQTGSTIVWDGIPVQGVDLSGSEGAALAREAGKNTVLEMHTHPGEGGDDSSFSDGDWMGFSWDHVQSSVVVAGRSIFSLTKTKAWDEVPWQKRTPAAIKRRWNEICDSLSGAAGDWTVDGVIRDTNVQLAKELRVAFTERARK